MRWECEASVVHIASHRREQYCLTKSRSDFVKSPDVAGLFNALYN